MTQYPLVTRIALDAGSQKGPLVWLAHALHYTDDATARALVDDMFDTDIQPDPDDLGSSRYPS